MRKQLRILIVEDSADEAARLVATIESRGHHVLSLRVDTPEAMADALDRGTWDLILTGSASRAFEALSPLALLTHRGISTPLIVVSEDVHLQSVVSAMKAGAQNYVRKSDLVGLAEAVEQELREAEGPQRHRLARTVPRKSEEQLRQAQKMEALGQLAGGIAHDFNNLLTVINGYSQLLLAQIGADNPWRNNLEEIQKAGGRAAALTNQLLAFSRKQVTVPEVLDLNAVIRSVLSLLQRLIGEDIKLVTQLDPDLGAVKADQGQLEQAILNLAINARDAMPNGGTLTLKTTNTSLDTAYVRRHIYVQPGAYVMLTIRDTGSGMDAETQSHLFEPFFTTKGPGKGTGLGLATVYGIVKQSGGTIGVSSEVGQGTTFRIYLPRVVEEPRSAEPASLSSGPVCGTETILLVEDEQMIRKLARGVLQSSGYTLLEACDGLDALRIGEAHRGPISLLITDVVMPGMSGRELAERLTANRPSMKVLYMSGYTDDAIVHHRVHEEGKTFLQKPFTLQELVTQVRMLLDGPGEASNKGTESAA